MNKFLSFFTHNWLLKLISLILATVLYLSLKDEPLKTTHNGNGKQKSRTAPINLNYDAMNTLLKALNKDKEKPEDSQLVSETNTNVQKKVSGQKNAK
jgi:YbbR domain-containing protein